MILVFRKERLLQRNQPTASRADPDLAYTRERPTREPLSWTESFAISSSRAAGELGDVSGEGLCGELQAFGHRQVRVPGVGQVGHSEAELDRVHTRLDDLTRALGQDMYAEDLVVG